MTTHGARDKMWLRAAALLLLLAFAQLVLCAEDYYKVRTRSYIITPKPTMSTCD